MSGYLAGYYTLIGQLFFYCIIAIFSARKMRSARDFFHADSTAYNTCSLIAANITLGTGLVYLISGGQQHGALMLLVPASTWIGYLWLAHLLSKTGQIVQPGHNVLASLQSELDKISPDDKIPYGKYVTGCLSIIYVLAFSYELLASSKVIAPYLSESPGPFSVPFISLMLFFTALFTVLFGGIRGVFRTDVLQLIAIVIVVLILVLTIASTRTLQVSAPAPIVLKYDMPTLAAVAVACLMAISTQFYSMLNWAYASHLAANDRPRVFRTAGFFTGVILAVVIACGIVAQSRNLELFAFIGDTYKSVGQGTHPGNLALSFLIVLGLTAVVCSTCDSLIISISQFVYDNIFRRDSSDASPDRKAVVVIRFSITVTFVGTFLGLLAMYSFSQDLFNLLLTIATPVLIFTPLFWLATRLLAEPTRMRILTHRTLWVYIGSFFFSFVLASFLLMFDKRSLIPFVGLGGLIFSTTYSMFLWKKSGTFRQKEV